MADTSTLSNWLAGTDASIAADTTNYKTGGQALEVDTQGNGRVKAIYDPTISVDLTAGPLVWWLYTDVPSAINDVGAYIFDFSGNYFRSRWFGKDVHTGWNRIEVTQAEANDPVEESGTAPDLTDIAEIQLTLGDAGSGTNAVATFDHVAHKTHSGNAKVLFRFDDAQDAVFDTATPVLDDYYMAGSVAAISGNIGDSGYLGESELRALQHMGWDVISHQTGTGQIDTLSAEDVESVFYESQKAHLDRGFSRGGAVGRNAPEPHGRAGRSDR